MGGAEMTRLNGAEFDWWRFILDLIDGPNVLGAEFFWLLCVTMGDLFW